MRETAEPNADWANSKGLGGIEGLEVAVVAAEKSADKQGCKVQRGQRPPETPPNQKKPNLRL
jgi:hypothetical protein